MPSSRSAPGGVPSGEAAAGVEGLPGGGEQFGGLDQAVAGGVAVAFGAVQVRAGLGDGRLPGGALPKRGGFFGGGEVLAGVVEVTGVGRPSQRARQA
jgi:hypothetical protein